MWKSHEFFNIHTIVENLSIKYQELESSYYSFLRKSHKENERILQQEANLTSQFFHNLLREQSLLENNIRQLASEGQVFNDQISQLKSILSQEQSGAVSPTETGDPFRAYSHYLNTKFNSLKTKVLSIPEFDGLEMSVMEKIDFHFQEAIEDVNATFSQLSEFNKESVGQTFDWRRIEEVINTNLPSFTGLEISLNSIKAKVIKSFGDFDTFVVSYNKEAATLRETIDQIKSQIFGIAKDAKSDSLRPMSPGSRTRGGEETNLSQQVRKSCTFVSQLLTDTISNEQNRNRLVNSVKEEMRTLRDDIKHQLHEISKHVLFLKGNNQRMTMTFEEELKSKRSRSVQEDSPGSRLKSTTRTLKPNVSTSKSASASALNEKKMNLLSPSKTPNSVLSVNSPLQAIIQNNNLKKHSHTVSGGEKFYHEHGFGSPLEANGSQFMAKTDENFARDLRADYEVIFKTLGQKLGYLETSVKNLIVSSGKVASFFVNFTGEEELALRVYESDKRSLESSLTSFKGFVLHTYDSLKTGSLATRSVDQDNPRRKEQSPLSTFSIRSPMRITNEEEDKHILIEDIQKEDNKKANPGRKGGDKKNQYAINDFQSIERSKKGINKDSPLQGALSEEGRLNVRALSTELATLKTRYESVSLERDQLKKENTTLNGRLKSSVDSSKYELTQRVEDLTVQKENLTKENLKLLKVVKKLHRKAEDRKKNLKQLFELMTEKEKELEQYKSGKTGVVDNASREEAILKQQKLEKDIKKKEKELKKLEEDIVEKKKEVGSAGRTPDYGAYTAQIAELDVRKQKLESVLAGMSSDAGAEVDEIQEMISLLSRERDLMVDKARIARNDTENWSSQQKDVKYGSMRQEQALKATIQQQEETITVLESEKKELETKCQEFMSDIESAQEHKKKIEKNYNEEIRILTNKLQELNNYIQELETKNTQRLRGSLGSDKWKTALAEDEIKEENKRLKLERETVVEALQGIIEDLEAEGYTNWDGYEALKKVWSTLQERIEEEKLNRHGYSSGRDQLGSYRSTEKGRDTARKDKAELEELIENLKDDLKQSADSNKKILAEVENLKQETNKYKNRSREYGDVLSRLRNNLEKHGWIERGYQNEDANQRVLLAVETVVSEYETLRKKKGGEDLTRKRSNGDEPENSRRLIVEKDKKIVDLNNEVHEAQERLAEIERTLIPSKEKIIKELREEVHGKNNEIHVLKNTIAGEKEKTILGLRDEVSDKNRKIHELQERLQRKVPGDESQETIQIYLEQNEQLRSEVAKINERLIGVNQHLDQMRQHNNQLMEEKKELEKLLLTSRSDQRKSSRDYSEQALSINMSSESRTTQKLQAEKVELEKQVFQISSLLEGAKADVMRLGHENKALHKELAATKERKNSFKEEKTSTELQIAELKDSLSHKTSAFDRQAKELEQVKKELRNAREQLDDLKAMDFNIKGHAEKVEEDLRRSEEKWLEMENTLEKVAREKEELSEQLTNLRQQVEEYEDTLETKQKQLDGLKVTVKEIEHLREEVRTKNDELLRSQTRCTELERAREELLEKVKELKKDKEKGEAHAESLGEVRGKILEYEVKIGEMKEDARIAQGQKEKLLQETEQLRDAYNRLQTRLDEKESTIEEKGREIEAVERKHDKLKREYQDLVLELDIKKRDLEEKEKEAEKIEKQYNTLKEEFLSVKNELQRSSQNLGLRDKDLGDKEAQYKKIESQYSMLQSQFEEKTRALETREVEYNKLRQEHERIGADAEKGKHASSTLEKQLESVREELRQLQGTFRNVERELAEKTDALEESQRQVENIRGQYEQVKTRYNDTHKELVEKKDALEVTAAELEEKQREYDELQKVYAQLENSLSDKEKAKELINKEKEHKEKEHNHLKEEFNKLQLLIREKEHAIESRVQELEDRNRLYKQLEDAHNVLVEQAKMLKKSVETKERELTDLTTKYNQEKESSNAFQDEIEDKVKEIEEIVKEMVQLKGAHNALQIELQSKTTALDNLKEDHENLEKTHRQAVSTLKAQLEHNEQHHHIQIKELRDDNSQLQHNLQAKEQEVTARDLEISGFKRKIESLQGEVTLEKQRRDELEVKHREELEQVEKEANERVGMNMEAISEKEKQLKDKNKEAKKKIAELQEENDDLQGQIRGLKVDLDNLGQSLSGRINELNKGIQEANNESDRMKTEYEREIEERNHKIAALEGEINALKDSVREKEQEIVNLTRKAKEEANKTKSESDDKLRERDGRVQTLENEIENLKQGLQTQKKELGDALDGAKKRMEELKHAYENDLNDRNTRITALEGEIAGLKTRLTAKESEVAGLTGQVTDLQKSKTEISAQYDQAKKSSEEAAHTTGEKINSLENQIAALKKEIGEKSDEITNLKKSGSQEVTQIREDYENRIASLKKEIETLNGQVASNKGLYEEHVGKLSKLQSEYNELAQKMNSTQASLEASKTEAGSLRDNLTQKTKENEEIKTKLEELSADRETLRQNVQELTSLKADYGSKLERMGSDKGSLETKYQALRDEKRSLEQTVSQLKQDLNNLTSSQVQHDQKTSEDLRQKNAIISSFSESFEELQKSQILKGKIDSRFQDKSQVGEAIQILRESLESKDEEIKKLTQQVQGLETLKKEAEASHSTLVGDTEKRLQDLTVQLTEKFNQEREDLQKSVKITKEDMEQRLLKLSLEIEDIVKSASLDLKPVSEEVKQKASVSEIEQTIHDYLSSLKNHIVTLEQVKKDYQTAEEESKTTAKQLEELKLKSSDLEKLQQTLEGEKKELQTEIQTLKETYKEREADIEKLRETIEKKVNKDKPSDFDLPSVDITEDFDENQIKKLMEDTFKVERKGDDRSDVEGGTQNIRYTLPVQEEIRELKDENERLDLEYRQLRSQHDLLLEVNEELKSEVNEKEDEVKKMEYQMAVLKEEFAKMEREKNQTTIAHEKQHIRMMFIKFMESALAGTKEAPELLKYLLALLDLSEANKNQILESFKAKTVKKSGFKVFT